ncbi:histidine kinase [Hylemonella gracilis]|uniref:histidine kinase n=1 Tax=Hylemonella gracilis TaxID=80880 RepID=A0A4P6UFS1_9BURK|nr:histidine kinase [Hylemonella gracilis]
MVVAGFLDAGATGVPAGAGVADAVGTTTGVQELSAARAVVRVMGQEPVVLGPVTLPYHWDRAHVGHSGQAEFELRFDAPGHELAQGEPYGIYFPRIGNTAEVWLNGTLLERLGDLDRPNTADYAKGPQYVTVPPQLITGADNRLIIRLHADKGRRGGLARPLLGPQAEVRPLYDATYGMRVEMSVIIAVFSLLVGSLALALWITQPEGGPARGQVGPQSNALYLAAFLAEYCWALRVGDVMIHRPPLPWPIWNVVVTAAFAGWIAGVGWFCHCVAGWHQRPSARWVKLGLVALVASSVLAAAMAQLRGNPVWLTVWLGMANLVFVAYALLYLWRALLHPQDRTRLVVGLIGTLNVVMGVRDWMAIRLVAGSLEVNTWIRYSSVLFGLALLVIMIQRFRAASQHARELTQQLSERVAAREQELALSYAKLETLARDQARQQERGRILKDMHDGVGVHLSTAIRQLRSGAASSEELLRTLTDSLDQLKLSIDAMQVEPSDVGAMLAGLRYRLEPRLRAGGITLHWTVDELPPLARLDVGDARNLQFLLFGVISNVLQHAQASHLSVSAQRDHGPEGAALHIVIEDDGQGFEPALTPGKGLQAMHERAAALMARLELISSSQGTRVELMLPIDVARPPAAPNAPARG